MFKHSNPDFDDIVLIDFGFATVPGDPNDRRFLPYVGTFGFEAPELLKCQLRYCDRYEEKVDMFALGMVIFSLVAQTANIERPIWLNLVPRLPREERDKMPPEQRRSTERKRLEHNLSSLEKIETWDLGELSRLEPNFGKLVKALCTTDTEKRLSAKQALRHPWFDEVWELIANGQVNQAFKESWKASETQQPGGSAVTEDFRQESSRRYAFDENY
jgi:serine/threonine protein kinase